MESILTEKELFLFIDDMIIYIDSSKVSTKNSLKNKEQQKQTPHPTLRLQSTKYTNINHLLIY